MTQVATIQVVLPAHLRTLAGVGGDVQLAVEGAITQRSILDALEVRTADLIGVSYFELMGQQRPPTV